MRLLALDRSPHGRWVDRDGRLHVRDTALTKGVVSAYRGHEIPNYQKLGLDAGRVYRLLRHPDALKEAAHTFCNLPVLSEHRQAMDALDDPGLVVGCTGTDARFVDPYIFGSLTLWNSDAIAKVESGEAADVSAGYSFTADMTAAGTYGREQFDGIMHDIRAHHIALVDHGRVRGAGL
jgi:hypothetical protein